MYFRRTITLFIPIGETDSLNLENIWSSDECARVIKSMAASYGFDAEYKVEYKHISYLLMKTEEMPGSGVAVTLSCDLSGFPWRHLIGVLKCDAIQIIISHGGSLSLQDIREITKKGSSENAAVLLLALEKCTPSPSDKDMTALFELALKFKKFVFAEQVAEYYPSLATGDLIKLIIKFLKLKKFGFVEDIMRHSLPLVSGGLSVLIKRLLKHKKFDFIVDIILQGEEINVSQITQELAKSDISGSKSNMRIISHLQSSFEGRIALFYKAVEFSEYKLAEDCLQLGTNETITNKICLSSVLKIQIGQNIEERKERLHFIKKLLEDKIDPNGQDKELNSLDAVLALPRDYQTEKIELLTLLLQHGAQIEHCTYQRKEQTTLIHIATRFAIDSGK